jgi:hypothetical protein
MLRCRLRLSNKRGGCTTYGRGRAAYRYRRGAAMTVLVEPFASVYDDRSRLGVILARGRSGFEAYAADDHSPGLFPSPRKAAAAITTTRPWVAQTTAEDKPDSPVQAPTPPQRNAQLFSSVSVEDLEGHLRLMRTSAAGARDGVFGPRSLMWRISREAAVFLG